MKRKFLTIKVLFLASFALVLMSNRGGSPGGKTGSTTDGGTCATNGGCHGGGNSSVIDQEMITSNIPASGYGVGQTYTITVSPVQAGTGVWGFELMAEGADGSAVGTFANNDKVNTKNDGQRATHKFASSSNSGGQTWTVEWTAPDESAGDVTFYGAALAANGNGNTGGDDVIIDNLVVAHNATASVTALSQANLTFYPNPAQDYLSIKGYANQKAIISVHTVGGLTVKQLPFTSSLDISDLRNGVYLLKISEESGTISKRFIKN